MPRGGVCCVETKRQERLFNDDRREKKARKGRHPNWILWNEALIGLVIGPFPTVFAEASGDRVRVPRYLNVDNTRPLSSFENIAQYRSLRRHATLETKNERGPQWWLWFRRPRLFVLPFPLFLPPLSASLSRFSRNYSRPRVRAGSSEIALRFLEERYDVLSAGTWIEVRPRCLFSSISLRSYTNYRVTPHSSPFSAKRTTNFAFRFACSIYFIR